jgi:putative DNA primase/helicase
MQFNTNSDQSVIDDFVAAMRAKDIPVDEPIIADGVLHRYHVEGDRGRSRNAWGVLHIDERPAGEFGCNKRYPGEKFPWSMQGTRDLNPAERAAMKEKAKLRAAQRQVEEDMRHAEAAQGALAIYEAGAHVAQHAYLTYKGVPSSPRFRVAPWYYTDEDTGEQILVCSNALIVPMMVSTTRILSLQAIIPDDREHSGFRKQFMRGGETAGTFVTIGVPHDDVILICEGIATGLSLWQCTQHGVLVAFTAGNLDAVARQVRLRRPDSRILICADNDAWTEKPIKNPGLHYAQAAAVQSGALVVTPEFFNTDTKPTDFNDLHQLEGEGIVRSRIARALDPTPAAEMGPFDAGAAQSRGEDVGCEEFADPAGNPYFAILGYNHGTYYLFQHEQCQLYEYTKGDLNEGGFLELAAANWWEENFPAKSGGFDKRGATNFIFRTANKRGIFTPDTIRGRGAWFDQGRSVFHHGQNLTVDGEKVDVTRLKSKFVYELAAAHCKPAERPTTDTEGYALLELAGKFRWTMPGSAALLMGWIALAPLCGALKWRPHIWITGNAGSGKSTIVESVINRLLDGMVLYGHGGSTEAGLRQMLKSDALPVLIDEFEQNEDKDVQRAQLVLSLLRQASTDSQARTFKGTPGGSAMFWHIRSMFCLASIQVGVKHQADTERISILTLQPKLTNGHAAEQWETLRDQIHELIVKEPDISGRLFRRTINMLPTILANIEVFKAVGARIFKSQRSGDQYGTLLAGAFALFSSKLATPADAEWVIKNYVWTEHVESDTHDESARAFRCLMAQPVKYGMYQLTVIELIAVARRRPPRPTGIDISPEEANESLGRIGLTVDDKDDLLIANDNSGLRALMADTVYAADLRGVLKRSPYITTNDNRTVRINCIPTKCLRGDLCKLLGESTTETTVEVSDATPF